MSYRLIWFQHFHKAAGSTIVETAALNGETFWPQHLNGNPAKPCGTQIPLWEFAAPDLTAFVDDCETSGVTFVATEWGMPNIEVLAADPRVVLLTCLREPLLRFVSNYFYDLYNGYTPARTLTAFRNSRQRIFTMDNYYCRILSRHGNNAAPLSQEHFERALLSLGKFDVVVLLAEGLAALNKRLGWRQPMQKSNENKLKLRILLSHLVRFRWQLIYLRLRYPKTQATDSFADQFKQLNQFDYQLFKELTLLRGGATEE